MCKTINPTARKQYDQSDETEASFHSYLFHENINQHGREKERKKGKKKTFPFNSCENKH